MGRKRQYVIGIDLNDEEQEKVRRFVRAMNYKSVRDFVKTAINEKIYYDLDALDPEQQKAVQLLLKV